MGVLCILYMKVLNELHIICNVSGLPQSRSSALDLYQHAGAGDDVLRLEKEIQNELAGEI